MRTTLFIAAAAALLAACSDRQPTAPAPERSASPALASAQGQYGAALAELRRVTARYHDIDTARADGFIPVTSGCAEEAGGEVMPIPFANIERLFDSRIDPSRPDALLYEPAANGRMRLVGVELAIPFTQWSEAAPPAFLGHAFEREEELGVYGLHIWVWSHNPEGMFAEGNPRITCAGLTTSD